MPFYEVHHAIPLTESQKSSLAQKITYVHSRKFTTPSLFVNVTFNDGSKQTIYVGGKPKTYNAVFARVRPGGTRKVEHFEELCEEVTDVWNEVVNGGKKVTGKKELRGVFVQGVLTAGVEAGFRLPRASEDTVWLKNNVDAFKKLADGGDEDFVDLVKELETREDFQAKL